MVFDQIALGLQENFKFSVILQKPLRMMAGRKKQARKFKSINIWKNSISLLMRDIFFKKINQLHEEILDKTNVWIAHR